MKKILLSALAVALSLCFARGAVAQESAAEATKPMLTVVFSGYDELKGDIGMIGQLGGNPELAQGLDMMVVMMTQGEGLASLDTARPWGVVASAKGEQIQVVGFLPLKDMDKYVKLLGKFGLVAKDNGKGVYEVAGPGSSIFMQKKGTWLVIGSTEDALGTTPADPLPIMGGLEKKYDIAIKASLKNIPATYKQLAVASMQLASQSEMVKKPGESADEFAARTQVIKQSIQRVVDLVNETDELMLGWSIDQSSKSAYLDLRITAIPETKLAKSCAAMTDAKTNFAGVNLPGAAVTASWACVLSDDDLVQFKSTFKQARTAALKDLEKNAPDDKSRELAKRVFTDVMAVMEKTLEGKKVDGGMALMLGPDAATVVMAGVLADGAKLEASLKQLVADVAKDDPKVAKMVKFNADTYKGVRLHTVTIPLPDAKDAAKAAKFVGSPAEIVLGVSDSALYVAAGRNAMKTLKTVVDGSASPKTISPLNVSVAVSPIVKFIAAADEANPQTQQVCQMIGSLLAKSTDKDHLTIVTKAVPGGVVARIKLEEGLLGLIGGASKMAGPKMPQDGAEQ